METITVTVEAGGKLLEALALQILKNQAQKVRELHKQDSWFYINVSPNGKVLFSVLPDDISEARPRGETIEELHKDIQRINSISKKTRPMKYYAHSKLNIFVCQTPNKIVSVEAVEEAQIVIFNDWESNGLYNIDEFREISSTTFQEQYKSVIGYFDAAITPQTKPTNNAQHTD